MSVWPKLSVELPGRDPSACQKCGATEALQYWREHDADDKPTSVAVVLCGPCANRIIEPHPRLYSPLGRHEPFPGIMDLCRECIHRDGVRCKSPLAALNGGEGIKIRPAGHTTVHVCRRGKGQRSGVEQWYDGPPTACSGREVAS